MFVQQFKYVVRADSTGDASSSLLTLADNTQSKIECYSGTQDVHDYGVEAVGSGATVTGTISGSIQAYDYKAIYDVYTLNSSESTQHWFYNYSEDSSQDVLQKTFESSQTTNVDYALTFQLQGNDFGVTAVYITYAVIRLISNGVTKDFVTTNAASAGAANADGSPYAGKFTPIPSPAG
jgi:hypothetical protein